MHTPEQCCGFALDPDPAFFGNVDPDPDLDPDLKKFIFFEKKLQFTYP
jgi:hypothetical protein